MAGTADYKVENGAIVGTTVMNSGNTFLVTEKEYGDFQLELDFMLESNVSNSGVQTRSHFNTPGFENKVYGRQVEFDPSERAWSGGIYDEARRQWLYPLDLNPKAKNLFKLGQYNHTSSFDSFPLLTYDGSRYPMPADPVLRQHILFERDAVLRRTRASCLL